MIRVPHLFLHEVQHPARGGHHQVNLLVDPHDVILQIGATCRTEHTISSVLTVLSFINHQIRSKI